MATRSIPALNTDKESGSGITWPPVENLELLWFEKTPPPESVAENFHIVSINDIGTRPGGAAPPAEPLEPVALESWGPATPVAFDAFIPAAAPDIEEPAHAFDPVSAIELLSPAESAPAIEPVAAALAAPLQSPIVVIVPGVARGSETGRPPTAVRVSRDGLTRAAAIAAGIVLVGLGITAGWRLYLAATTGTSEAPPAASLVAQAEAPPSRPSAVRKPAKPPASPRPVPTAVTRDQQSLQAGATPPGKALVAPSQLASAPARSDASHDAQVAPVSTPEPEKSASPPAPAPQSPETALAVPVIPFAPQPTISATASPEEAPAAATVRPVPPPPTSSPAAAVTAPSDEQRIRGVLRRYQSAYEQFDPDAVKAVWPGVDTRALGRAFDGLSSQTIVFDHCDVNLAGSSARAACLGGVEYVMRVGGGGAKTARRQWTFDLQKSIDGAWHIRTLTSR